MRRWVLGIVDNYRKAWVLLAIGCLTIELFMITPKIVRAQAPLSHDEVSHTISGSNQTSSKGTAEISPKRTVEKPLFGEKSVRTKKKQMIEKRDSK